MPSTIDRSPSRSAGRRETASGLDPGRLSDIIGAIYDCVLEPANWPTALAAACNEFSFDSAIIGIGRGIPVRMACQYATGVDPLWLARIPDYAPEMLELWGGLERMQGYPLDEPIVNSQAVDPAVTARNRYASEWRKRGIHDAAIMILARDPSLIGSVGFNRHETMGTLTVREIEGLRVLGPHFRRAVTISDLFEMKTVAAAAFASVIDAFSCGMLLVDGQQAILHANRAASAMLATREPIEARRGYLVLHHQEAAAALQRTLQSLSLDETAVGSRGIGIPLRQRDGSPCVIHVLPLRSDGLRSRFGQRAAAALFFASPSAAAEPPMAVLALLYDLTPAEARVCELLVRGMTQRGIAAMIGIAPSTVKTHLLRLYAKTGCRRQSDLVTVARDLSVPL